MNVQLANYVRGKFIEILIVGFATYATFSLLGLNYCAAARPPGRRLGADSVRRRRGGDDPGAAGGHDSVRLVLGHWPTSWGPIGIIQALDGNILVPLLFSEAVDLHPIAIIVAVLAFGGLWGLCGACSSRYRSQPW